MSSEEQKWLEDTFNLVCLTGLFAWCSVARSSLLFFPERGRRGEADQYSLFKVCNWARDFYAKSVLLLPIEKGTKNFCNIKHTLEFSNFFGIYFEWREINPSISHCHMLSELGNMEVCKSIQKLGPSLPTNRAETKGKKFRQRNESHLWTAETVKQMPGVQTARQPASLPKLGEKRNTATREHNRRVQAGEKWWWFRSPNLASFHSLLSTLSKAGLPPQS